VPFLLAEDRSAFGVVFEVNRDLYYGVYALTVVSLFALWSRSTGYTSSQPPGAAGLRHSFSG
jgi:hypothetical protein